MLSQNFEDPYFACMVCHLDRLDDLIPKMIICKGPCVNPQPCLVRVKEP